MQFSLDERDEEGFEYLEEPGSALQGNFSDGNTVDKRLSYIYETNEMMSIRSVGSPRSSPRGPTITSPREHCITNPRRRQSEASPMHFYHQMSRKNPPESTSRQSSVFKFGDVEDVIRKLTTENSALRARIEDLESTASADESEITVLLNQLETQSRLFRSECSKRRELDEENAALKDRINQADAVVNRLTSELAELQQRLGKEQPSSLRPTRRGASELCRSSGKEIASPVGAGDAIQSRKSSGVIRAARCKRSPAAFSPWIRARAAVKPDAAKSLPAKVDELGDKSVMGSFGDVVTSLLGGFGMTIGEETTPEGAKCTRAQIRTEWESWPLSKNVKLSHDRRVASYTASDKTSECGFVATTVAPLVRDSHAFEVRITKVRSGEHDGLAVGFTSTPPNAWPRELPNTADCFASTWLVGYDGQFWNGHKREWSDCSWNSAELRVGDRVGVKVSCDGAFVVSVNRVTVWQAQIHVTTPLFGVVDLIGNTDEVTLVDPMGE
eukprot:TRINITY_DN10135_c0_g3_i2.p1 TRINITY_DN10135_c0_g3~~TRINITY_DN10135_c0_g3_i2.p1  ORF type:complete len:498 (+),score=65.03 TRINITY_DN10135_c0_g3_i2:225-1718(+)